VPVELVAGQADPALMAKKMANSIDQKKELQDTYLPNSATLARFVGKDRTKGRQRLRAGTK
jgi:hypothetical protein